MIENVTLANRKIPKCGEDFLQLILKATFCQQAKLEGGSASPQSVQSDGVRLSGSDVTK